MDTIIMQHYTVVVDMSEGEEHIYKLLEQHGIEREQVTLVDAQSERGKELLLQESINRPKPVTYLASMPSLAEAAKVMEATRYAKMLPDRSVIPSNYKAKHNRRNH